MRRTLLRGLPLLLITQVSCDVPRDPVGTLARARGDTLRVGAVAAPPYVVVGERVPGEPVPIGPAEPGGPEPGGPEPGGPEPGGPEADLVRAFARGIDAEIEWHWGSLDEHMKSLETFELDLVAAGLTMASPWKKKVGFSRPWRVEGKRKHVLAVPPGENGLLTALEVLIEARARGAAVKTPQRQRR